MTDNVTAIIGKLSNKLSKFANDPEKIELYSNMLSALEKELDDLDDLDINLQEYMYETKNTNEIVSYLDFPRRLKETSDDSLIIYIKKAQIYKIYNAETLNEFEQDVGTHYRKSEFGPAYEVVRDSSPQKLMIIIQDDVETNKLQSIKTLLVAFTKIHPVFANIALSDMLIYNSDNNIEFVISSITFDNMHEKEQFIESFIVFTENNGENELAKKIKLRPPPSNIPNTRYYKLPCSKECTTETNSSIIDQLITPQKSSVVINNTFIIQNGNNNNNNINCGSFTTNITEKSKKTSKKTIKTFCKHIYNNKPDWYEENSYVSIDIIEDEYRKYFEDTSINKSMISRYLNKSMFDGNMRTNGVTKKKLLSFKNLKKSF